MLFICTRRSGCISIGCIIHLLSISDMRLNIITVSQLRSRFTADYEYCAKPREGYNLARFAISILSCSTVHQARACVSAYITRVCVVCSDNESCLYTRMGDAVCARCTFYTLVRSLDLMTNRLEILS